MDFFQQLFELSETLDISIQVKRKNERLTLSVLPTSAADIAPVIITGTPDDLDGGFFDAIKEPIGAAVGLQVQLEEFNKSVARENPAKRMDKKGDRKPAKSTDSVDEAPEEDKIKEPTLFDEQ